MVSTKVLLKFLPGYSVCICVYRIEGIPPVERSAFESSRSVQDLLSVVALCNVQFLSNDLKPVIGIQGVNHIRESRWVMSHEIPMLVSSLWCIRLLMLVVLILFYLLHRSSESLQKLHLRCDELLHVGIWWWWWQLLTTLVSVVPGT